MTGYCRTLRRERSKCDWSSSSSRCLNNSHGVSLAQIVQQLCECTFMPLACLCNVVHVGEIILQDGDLALKFRALPLWGIKRHMWCRARILCREWLPQCVTVSLSCHTDYNAVHKQTIHTLCPDVWTMWLMKSLQPNFADQLHKIHLTLPGS